MGVVTCLTFWNPPREISPSSRSELGLLVGTSGRTPSVALWIWEKASPSNARCVSALDHSPLFVSLPFPNNTFLLDFFSMRRDIDIH